MKKFRLGLMALAALGSVGTAFATNHKAHSKDGTLYHVKGKSGTNYIVTAVTSGHCVGGATTCLITSTATPSMSGNNLVVPIDQSTPQDDDNAQWTSH